MIIKDLYIDKVKVYNLVSDDTKNNILNELSVRYSLEYNFKNKKLLNSNTDFTKITLLSLQPIGNQYLLYLTKYEEHNYCFLISKKRNNNHQYPQIMVLNYRFNTDLFSGCVFDTNLIKISENKLILQINDIIVYNNNKVNDNIIVRQNLILDILNNQYIEDNITSSFDLNVIKLFNIQDIKHILNTIIPELPYKIHALCLHSLSYNYSHVYLIDNIKFKKNYNPTLSNNTKVISKDKNNDIKHNVCKDCTFKISITEMPDIYNLYIENDIFVGIANIPTLKCSKFIKDLLLNNDYDYVVCIHNNHFNKWEPLKKSNQNLLISENQFNKILKNI